MNRNRFLLLSLVILLAVMAVQLNTYLSSPRGLYHTGTLYLLAKNHETALHYFEEAVKKNSSYVEAHALIGYCNGKLGRYTKSIEAYRQAIRIKPDYAEAYHDLGIIYGKIGQHNKSRDYITLAKKIKPDVGKTKCDSWL
jgi:tetratricopeptide (TPR) repeat protein